MGFGHDYRTTIQEKAAAPSLRTSCCTDKYVWCGLVARIGCFQKPTVAQLTTLSRTTKYILCGLMARIRGSHLRGLGSIPGSGRHLKKRRKSMFHYSTVHGHILELENSVFFQ